MWVFASWVSALTSTNIITRWRPRPSLEVTIGVEHNTDSVENCHRTNDRLSMSDWQAGTYSYILGLHLIMHRTNGLYLASLSSTSSYSEIFQSTTTLSAGGKAQLFVDEDREFQTVGAAIQGFQYRCTNCLELSVFIYEKFHYHHHLQGTSENRTVRCCIRLSLTFLLPPVLPVPPINVIDIDH